MTIPKEGTLYTIKKGIHSGLTGIVTHHDCGTRFMVYTGKNWACNIKQ